MALRRVLRFVVGSSREGTTFPVCDYSRERVWGRLAGLREQMHSPGEAEVDEQSMETLELR